MSDPKAVLITGAGSGFGRLTARALAAAGHTVFATLRDPEGRNAEAAADLRRLGGPAPGTIHTLELDVTDDGSVETAVARALELVDRIDVAVNNAGVGMSGFTEAFSAAEVRRLFEVNLFGVQRVNRAVLPSMREAGSGLLVHVSSIMGRLVIPFAGPYTATKWALEGLAESYRYELAGTGVEVTIVEPGAFVTGHAERISAPADERRSAAYGELTRRPERMWGRFVELLEEASPDPARVAAAIHELIELPAGRRPLRVVVDPMLGGSGPRAINRAAAAAQAELLATLGLEVRPSVDEG